MRKKETGLWTPPTQKKEEGLFTIQDIISSKQVAFLHCWNNAGIYLTYSSQTEYNTTSDFSVWIHSVPYLRLVALPRPKKLICLTIYQWLEREEMDSFPKGINVKWNSNNLIQDSNLDH